jgi:carboxypeptidase family protein
MKTKTTPGVISTVFRKLLPVSFFLTTVVAATAVDVRQGTGLISGVVTDSADRKPIARAKVVLSGAALRPNLVAIADAAGRFAFGSLPSGQFTVSASKSAYLTMAYGQTAPGRGSGVPLSLSDGQQMTGLTLALPRAAAISGRILDDRGQPMPGVNVVLLQYRAINGERTLTTSTCCDSTKTDGRGMYRIHEVTPGDYLVSAVPPGDYLFIGAGQWFPGADDIFTQVEADEMRWAQRQVTASAGGGPTIAAERPPAESPRVAYGRAYFPGTADAAGAEAVSIRGGEDRAGVDFAMKLQRVARIDGRVVWPNGQAIANTFVSIGDGSRVAVAPDGSFSRANVLPAKYKLTVRAGNSFWGTQVVDVTGVDVTGVTVTMGPSATMSGRIVFDSATTPPPADLRQVRISLRPVSPGSQPVAAGPDGTFAFPAVDPGRYTVFASLTAPARGQALPGPSPAPAWTLKSVMQNGRDVSDLALEIAPQQQVADLVVTFTDRATELSGTLFDAAGRPAPGYYVVAFSQDESAWVQGSRRLPPPARAATDGRFSFAGLPAGKYFLAALTNVDQNDLADAAFLRQIAAQALAVTLGDGEKKTQDLKFAGR